MLGLSSPHSSLLFPFLDSLLDRQGDNWIIADVTTYATGFMNIIKTQFPSQVAAAMRYAWADGMDNGYGLVGANDQPKQPLYQKFVTL